jgi:hypothetical protein
MKVAGDGFLGMMLGSRRSDVFYVCIVRSLEMITRGVLKDCFKYVVLLLDLVTLMALSIPVLLSPVRHSNQFHIGTYRRPELAFLRHVEECSKPNELIVLVLVMVVYTSGKTNTHPLNGIQPCAEQCLIPDRGIATLILDRSMDSQHKKDQELPKTRLSCKGTTFPWLGRGELHLQLR